MADLDTGQPEDAAPSDNEQPAATASEPASDAAAPEAPANDLDSLLTFFDRTVKDNGGQAGEASEGDTPTVGAVSPDIAGEFAEIRNWALELDADYKQRLDRDDAAALFAEGQEAISDLPVADDFAERWLMSEALVDPNLADAWTNRHNDEESAARYRSAGTKALQKLVKAAQSVPDPVATADREAVTAAVRGASKTDPSGGEDFDADAVARMNDQDFAHWTKHTAPKLVNRTR